MKSVRVRAIAKKEMLQISRDPLSLAIAFLMPLMLLFIFGYAISLDVDNLTTVVYDRDRTSESRELISAFRESGYFSIAAVAETDRDMERHLDAGSARVAVWIPEDFARNIRTGKDAPLQIIVDGSDSNTATIALGYLSGATALFAQRMMGEAVRPALDYRVRVWYNPDLRSRNSIIPGLIAVIMAIIAALLTALTVAREWERGTMEQLLATPVTTSELIMGKLIPYFFIGLVDVVTAVLLGVYLFGVPLKGNAFLLMALSSVFLFGGLSQGILISIVAKSQTLASQVAMIATYLPAFLLSGFMFAISNMPAPLQVLTHIIPARYFVALLKGIFLKGSALKLLAFEAALLSAFGLVVFALARTRLRKRIA